MHWLDLQLLIFWICIYFVNDVGATCNFTTYEEYISTWRNRYYTEAQKLYPYGETYCDQNVTLNIQLGFNPRIEFPVYFYGVKYLSLWVTPHGVISLSNTTQPKVVPGYVFKPTWPNDAYPDTHDIPFIAPFYSEADFQPLLPNEPSRLSWRVLDPSQSSENNEKEITIGMLNALSEEMRKAVVGADDFVAEFGLIITWHKVTFGASDCTTAESCVRNTYQMALVVGAAQTYVIYNYFDIKWVGGAGKQRCDPSTGLSSTTNQDCLAAHIGFNAGYGRHFYHLPYSFDIDKTKDIDIRSGSNVVGRFIYSVAGDRILRGGCTNDTGNLDNNAWPLETVPVSTDMIGGVAVDVSAPCFHQNMLERTKCSFDGVETDPVRNTHTTMKATCVPPQLSVVGSTTLALIVDGTAKYHTQLLINLPGRNEPKVQLSLSNSDWLNPDQIQVTWDPSDLKDTNGTVDIILAGYREGDNSENVWEHLEILSQMHSNSGSFTFNPDSFQCGSGMAAFEKCFQYHLGAVQVAEHRDDPLPPKSLWSEVIPFGWYIKTAMQSEHGSDWTNYLCKEWDYLDQRNGGWSDRDNLPPCPCTLQQALFDYGRYQPDAQCHMTYTGSNKCRYNIGAKHCVVSMHSTGSESSGSRCCYGSDDLLLYSGDSLYGSCPDRAHEWGQYPYSTPPRVPSLSHWVKDIAPWYYCCQWQENKEQCYNVYLGNRNTVDCQQYESPGFASSYGDPHFSTFDGTAYTFNGHGEFWLMSVTGATLYGQEVDFHMQLRMLQPPADIWGEVKATITSAVAIKLQGGNTQGQIITFVIDEFYVHSDNKLMVYVDDQLLSFSEQEAHVQEYQDFIIVNHDPPEAKSATNFTVAYRLGVGVRVCFHNGLIQTMISAPPEFKHKTRGLVGQWNDNPSDDLLPKGGGNPVSPEDMENVHHSFGLTWMIVNSESMFGQVYRAQMDYYYYRDESFLPNFTPVAPEPNASSWKAAAYVADTAICGDNKACQYDYSVTGSETVAMETKLAQERWEEVRKLSSKVHTCGWLSIPNSIKKQPYNYLLGSVVTIEGCMHNYNLEGPTEYTCQHNGEGSPNWNPPLSTRCADPDAGLSPAIITAIAIPAAILFFLLIFGLVVLVIWLHKRRSKGKPTRPSEIDNNYIEDSFSQALPPVPMKTAGKPRPTVNTSLTYSTDYKEDSSFEKASLSSPNESTYTDMTKGSKKKKRQKSANLDDSISMESDEKSSSQDRLNIDFDKDVKMQQKKTKTTGKQRAKEQPENYKVSYKPDPSSPKTRSNTKSTVQSHIHGDRDRHQPPPPPNMLSTEVRKPPYQYPRSKPNILSGVGPPRLSPYYNPPSPPQRKKPLYVYPQKEKTTFSGRSSPYSHHHTGNPQSSGYFDSHA